MHFIKCIHIYIYINIWYINTNMYAFFIRVKLHSQSMVQNLDPRSALKKKLEHRANTIYARVVRFRVLDKYSHGLQPSESAHKHLFCAHFCMGC